MTHDLVDQLCRRLATADPHALVVASDFAPGSHVTVIHEPDQTLVIDTVVGGLGLIGERTHPTMVKVTAPA